MTDEAVFSASDELVWHQLDILRRISPPPGNSNTGNGDGEPPDGSGESWGLPDDLDPYPWQHRALEAWEENNRSGIVKVVTGAGKTVLALMCLDRLLREDAEVRASVVVPTRVLLDQWYGELTETLRLPRPWVGRRSSDYKDEFAEDRRVMIYVINSARTALGRCLSGSVLEAHHFLIVDECHRAGSSENRAIFDVPRRYSLGLSATPERDYEAVDEIDEAADEDVPDVVQQELGNIIFELSFEEALDQGIIPPFEIIHCAVSLTPEEGAAYEKLSRELIEIRGKLRSEPAYISGSARIANEFRLLKSLAKREGTRAGNLAARFDALTKRRKELLYRAMNRSRCFRDILEEERASGRKIMAFHERITEVNRLFEELVRGRVPAVLDHTGLTQTQRERSLDLYLRGVSPVLLSVKALIEGVNAPATDVGVIVAASSSPRQKIQSIGRVMRPYEGKATSRIYNIYVGDTSDEHIFRLLSFEDLLGVGRVEYRAWQAPGHWKVLDAPPRIPRPPDSDIDPGSLEMEGPYPGRDEGFDLSLDTQGNVYREVHDNGHLQREFTSFPPDVLEAVEQIRPGGGKLRVTPNRGFVLVLARDAEGEWEFYYAGQVPLPLEWKSARRDRVKLKLAGKFGGSITVSERGSRVPYDNRSPAAQKILKLVAEGREKSGEEIHKIELDPEGRVYTRLAGRERELGRLDSEDGWPFGKKTFEQLRREVEHGS